MTTTRPSPTLPLFLRLGLTLLCALLTQTSCQEDTSTPAPEPARPVGVKIATRESRPVQLSYVGVTMSEAMLRYGFKVPGRLAQIHVKKGQAVQPGQALARVQATDHAAASRASRLSVSQAQEAFNEAERTYQRIKTLYEDGARSQHDFEQARLAYEVRKSSLAQARVKAGVDKRALGDTTLRSETEGFVVDVLAKKGELIAPGHPVVLVRAAAQVVDVGVSQRDVKRLNVGGRALVTVDGEPAEGVISAIDAIPDPTSRTYGVEVSLTSPLSEQDFLIGSVAKVAFDIGEESAFWVPVTAVLTEGMSYVMVVDEGRAVRKNVTLGKLSGSQVEVDGLNEGDKVIVEGMKNLEDGTRVEVM